LVKNRATVAGSNQHGVGDAECVAVAARQ
jgi:hypothetical protein